MGAKESLKEIKIINTLNSDVDRSNRNNSSAKRYKNIYKRQLRRNLHTVKITEKFNKNENHKKQSKKKHIMTKEQRNLLKTFLKENVKENKKTIAKNLIGIFLESNKNNKKGHIKYQINNNIETKTEKKYINQTPKANFPFKNEQKNKIGSSNSIKKIKKLSSFVPPSIFNKEYKKTKEKDESKNKEKIKQNNQNDMQNHNEIINNQEQNLNNGNNSSHKMNFTSLFKLQQDINEVENKRFHKFSTPRGIPGQTKIEKKFELDEKNGIIFKRKSFRDFVENNNRKDYDECLKFFNTTHIISHLDESNKSLLIQSLKIKKFNKDECILKAHEKCSKIYFVKNGLLQCVDGEGKCIKTVTTGEYFGEKEMLIDLNIDFNLITISDCVCYSLSEKIFKKMFGHKYRNFILYNFMMAAFDCSKLFQTMNMFYIEQMFNFFNIVNLNKDNVAFPIGHIKSSKFVIIISGHLINSKNEIIIGRPLDILFEEELLSHSDEKTNYALNPSPDALFLEGDTEEILKYLKCKSFEEVLNKNIVFENLSKIVLFKSFSQLKLFKLIDMIQMEKNFI